ncbi:MULTISPECIES: efflux RND transporter periplasmic adaptor subunit [Vibrio]|uniref:Efflux transporter periplasmic adaptor subunit n=1 Tax=Vibrio bivalvicida TaxID=1276888 RepID=A0A177Y1Q4_9VIBR|nr:MULTISPECIES: biotin/lipoyl-binding protein [Vibrio]KLN64852.1 RND transporter [Vibrio sp. VPAP30]OAJ94788.1 efflux transporter periplasmic adaptor subunit [Vibrio bivalvicida]
MNKLALSLGLTLTLAPTLFFGCQLSQAKPSANSTAYMVQLPIERKATKLIALEGEFKPSKYTKIQAENSGKIANIYVQDGEYVEKGQPLLDFDATLAALAVKTAQNEYQMATRNIIELTRTTGEDDPRFESAVNAVEATRSNLLIAQQDHEATTMYAPFSGTLGQFHLNAGNYVNEGELITELVATNTVELHFTASPQVLNVFRQVLSHDPDSLQASIVSPEGSYIDGKLRYIDSKLANQELSAYAIFDNRNGEHLIGSKTAFYLNSPQQEPQLFVPVTAIHTNDGTPTLFVLDDKRVVRPKQVTIAKIKESYTGYVPIKSGLEPNDFVLTTPEAPELVGKKIDPMVNLVNQLNEILNRQS